MSEKDPRWQRRVALLTIIGLAAAGYLFRDRLAADFLPLDSSRVGPNLLASVLQAAVVLVVVALLYPPWRRAVHRFVDRKLGGVHERVDQLHDRHDDHAAQLEAVQKSLTDLHKKLDARPVAKVARRKPPLATAKPVETVKRVKGGKA